MNSKFNNVAIKGFVSVFPENKINIDDEIQYFDNSEKKLNRAKKMIGFGTRYVVAPNTTVVDLAEHAANILIGELDIDKTSIDALILTLRDNNKLVRREASTALSRMGQIAVDPLIEILDDEDWRVRGAAAWALGNLKDDAAIEPLEALLEDESGYVRAGALNAINSIKS